MTYFTVRVVGGLGNQLHCYAFGRALAEQSNIDVRYDCESGYWADPYGREFLMDEFKGIRLTKAGRSSSGLGRRISKGLLKIASISSDFLPLEWKWVVQEPKPLRYRAEILRANYRFGSYFVGHWVSFRYCESIKAALQQELSLPVPKEDSVLSLLDEIDASNSCAIHWRSYAEEVGRTHDPLEGYYRKAVRCVMERYPDVRFFIFSDKPLLARKKFDWLVENSYFVQLPQAVGNRQSLNDFYLMRFCKHAIIGDSTFSWWAAWLDDRAGKTVIAPAGLSPWGRDWAPDEWIAIPAGYRETQIA